MIIKQIITIALLTGLIITSTTTEAREKPDTLATSIGSTAIFIGFPTYLSFFHEQKLTNQTNLKMETGLFPGFAFSSELFSFYSITPIISIEPRWYYDLNLRKKRNLNISNNAGNFIALNVLYYPYTYNKNIGSTYNWERTAFSALWGMRRNIGSRFHIEFGAGLRYHINLIHSVDTDEYQNIYLPHLNLRVGFNLY